VKRPRVRIGSLEIDDLDWSEALEKVAELAARRRGGYVTTPNVDHVVLADSDPGFREINREADLVFADGMPLLWVARLLGTPLRAKISGSDFLVRFAAPAAARRFRLFFLGGRPGAAAAAARRLREENPGLEVAGVECPPFGFELDPERNRAVTEAIRRSGADLVFVGLGTPKQERWISRYRRDYHPAFSVPCGAGFDFLSGQVPRAPRWMRRAGMEWCWRLLREPRRLGRRYLVRDARFLPIVFRQWLHGNRTR